MEKLGVLQYYLGMEVWQNLEGIFVSHTKNVSDLIKKFQIMDCKASDTIMDRSMTLTKDYVGNPISTTMCKQSMSNLISLTIIQPGISLLFA
jgi:hypothetical protein